MVVPSPSWPTVEIAPAACGRCRAPRPKAPGMAGELHDDVGAATVGQVAQRPSALLWLVRSIGRSWRCAEVLAEVEPRVRSADHDYCARRRHDATAPPGARAGRRPGWRRSRRLDRPEIVEARSSPSGRRSCTGSRPHRRDCRAPGRAPIAAARSRIRRSRRADRAASRCSRTYRRAGSRTASAGARWCSRSTVPQAVWVQHDAVADRERLADAVAFGARARSRRSAPTISWPRMTGRSTFSDRRPLPQMDVGAADRAGRGLHEQRAGFRPGRNGNAFNLHRLAERAHDRRPRRLGQAG